MVNWFMIREPGCIQDWAALAQQSGKLILEP